MVRHAISTAALLGAAGGLFALAAYAAPDIARTAKGCVDGIVCELHGRLDLVKGGHGGARSGVLAIGKICFDLAIAPETFAQIVDWKGRRVVVTGSAFMHPTDLELMWYEFRDRRIEPAWRNSVGIYVDRIVPE